MAAALSQDLHATRRAALIHQADDFRLRRAIRAGTSRRLSRALRRRRPAPDDL